MATGSQWDVIQVFAWGRMVTDYSRTMPVASAFAKTFDGEMCPICRAVDDARKQEQSERSFPEVKFESKILLFIEPTPEVIFEGPISVAWFPAESSADAPERPSPPVPPPRAAWA